MFTPVNPSFAMCFRVCVCVCVCVCFGEIVLLDCGISCVFSLIFLLYTSPVGRDLTVSTHLIFNLFSRFTDSIYFRVKVSGSLRNSCKG